MITTATILFVLIIPSNGVKVINEWKPISIAHKITKPWLFPPIDDQNYFNVVTNGRRQHEFSNVEKTNVNQNPDGIFGTEVRQKEFQSRRKLDKSTEPPAVIVYPIKIFNDKEYFMHVNGYPALKQSQANWHQIRSPDLSKVDNLNHKTSMLKPDPTKVTASHQFGVTRPTGSHPLFVKKITSLSQDIPANLGKSSAIIDRTIQETGFINEFRSRTPLPTFKFPPTLIPIVENFHDESSTNIPSTSKAVSSNTHTTQSTTSSQLTTVVVDNNRWSSSTELISHHIPSQQNNRSLVHGDIHNSQQLDDVMKNVADIKPVKSHLKHTRQQFAGERVATKLQPSPGRLKTPKIPHVRTNRLPNVNVHKTNRKFVSGEKKGLLSRISEKINDVKCSAGHYIANRQLENIDYVRYQINCILERGSCDKLGKMMKQIAPEVLKGLCPYPCNECKRKQMQKIMAFVAEKFPRDWNMMLQRFSG